MEEDNKKSHGEFIAELKAKSGKTWDEISSVSGYSRTTLHRWQKEKYLSPQKIIDFADACGINIDGYVPEVDNYKRTYFKDYEKQLEVGEGRLQVKYVTVLERLSQTQQELNEFKDLYYTAKEELDYLKTGQNRDKSSK